MIHAFVDCSTASGANPEDASWLSRWCDPASLLNVSHGTYFRPSAGAARPVEGSGWSPSRAHGAVAACNEAIEHAAGAGRRLLVVLRPLSATGAAIAVLRESLALDPMFGFAVPRLGSSDGLSVATLPLDGVLESGWAPRRILAELPEHEILLEHTCACVLIASGLLADFGPLDAEFERLDAALVHYMARARRCGFRVVVSNRAVVAAASSSMPEPAGTPCVAASDRARLLKLAPDRERAWSHARGSSAASFERVVGAALARNARGDRFSLLLDLRNLGDIHNGTSRAALGIAGGLYRLGAGSEIEVLATPAGIAFHRLEESFPRWRLHTSAPDAEFTVALRLSQPWHVQELVDLHHSALFNTFLFLDTISWDVQYLAPPHLDGTWRFLADHADAFFFISDFTRRRFHARFEGARETPYSVVYLSLHADDYIARQSPQRNGGDPYILVIGNELEHKDVSQTVELLSTAFPFQRFQVLGSSALSTPRVGRHRSGSLTEDEVYRLYAGARAVVYPSFYEGFGFPIVTALGHGLTVLARRSDLLDEITARCQPSGRLMDYGRREELVPLVGKLLHGEPLDDRPAGSAFVPGHPYNWDRVGREILDMLETLTAQPSGARWRRREHSVQQMLAFRG